MNQIEYLKSLPKKRIAAGILLFNRKQELLILKTSYREGWTIPGGVVEPIESPLEGAKRETKEETGLSAEVVRCLLMDHRKYEKGEYIDESLQIIYLGKELTEKDIADIKIDNKEIVAYEFLPYDTAIVKLSSGLYERLKSLEDDFNGFKYLENGEAIC